MQVSSSKRLLAVCASSIALSWALPCLAEGPEPEAASQEARARFEQGVRAFEQSRHRDAIELFKEADRLSPSARSSFNIAKVYERMGDDRSALAAYRDYLRRLPAAENGAPVGRRITELEHALQLQGVQQLSVISNPSGATVLIDGVSRGVTPWTSELKPGAHQLSLRLGGHREAQQHIELGAQHAMDVSVELAPATETETAPPGALPVAPAGKASAALPTEPVVPWDGPAASGAPLEAPPLPPRQEPVASPRWLTWSLFATSGAALVAAGAFELSRANMEEQADSSIQVVHDDKYAAMQRRQTAARVSLGVGIASAVAGSISLYFDLEAPSQVTSEVAVGCAKGDCELSVGGRF